jgi:AAA+ ATPase superfamily predicted ATPase
MSEARRPFVNREEELAALRALADRGSPALALVNGRRRVGKTYLLDHAWSGRRLFYFLAANSTAEMNRAELLRELAGWSGKTIDPLDYPTWRTVFRLFVDLADEGPLIVVLDEFQYLLNQVDDIASQLVAVWDREVRGRPLLPDPQRLGGGGDGGANVRKPATLRALRPRAEAPAVRLLRRLADDA